jgi:predicted RNA-binding protein YlxR (DUF448 family)
MRPRHVPMRTCIGCQQEQPKRQLVRVVRLPVGSVAVDPTGKAGGRGAYLCRQPECWTAALRRGALTRALRVTLTDEDRSALEAFRASLAAVATSAEG